MEDSEESTFFSTLGDGYVAQYLGKLLKVFVNFLFTARFPTAKNLIEIIFVVAVSKTMNIYLI